MTGRNTERRGKGKDVKSGTENELENEIATFTLPGSLQCSEIDLPTFSYRTRLKAKWNGIVEESEKKFQEVEEFEEKKKEYKPISPFLSIHFEILLTNILIGPNDANTERYYLQNKVFIHLEPALEETLHKACIWRALKTQKCFFNGIDHIAQVLWNNNPKHPERKDLNLHIFNMPWVRQFLKLYPRSYYPKSWLWTEEYAATMIQKTLRQYFVQRDSEVQEMRSFWRKIEMERSMPELQLNPLLSKKFASSNVTEKN